MEINIATRALTNDLLKDESGSYYRAIVISADNLATFIDTDELEILKQAVAAGGVNLLVSAINDLGYFRNLTYLTNSAIIGAGLMAGNHHWHFTTQAPTISADFTGLSFSFHGKERAFSLNLTKAAVPILLSQDNDSTKSAVFAVVSSGTGKIFIDGCIQKNNLEKYQLNRLYRADYLNDIIPTMMFLKYAGADECWHNNNNYANLTIDDPYFREPYGHINYHDLLVEMEKHNFHTTIALIPERFFSKQQAASVLKLFRTRPNRYSIVQHGNNHDGYEFICFTRQQLDTINVRYNNTWKNHRPRPYREQEADIVEGKTRLGDIRRITGIPHGNIMVFPYGISLSPTLVLLKTYNFNATVNDMNLPRIFLKGDNNSNFDFNMRLANMNFGNFPVVKGLFAPVLLKQQRWPFDAFLDKPLLLFAHDNLFDKGIDQFNDTADFLNTFFKNLEWRGMGDIIKKMYLEKTNDDGSVSVKFYGNNLVVTNATAKVQLYHFQKEDRGNVPIIDVKVDKNLVKYDVIDSTLQFEVTIPAHTSKEILITYSAGNKDFAIKNSDLTVERAKNRVYAKIHNVGTDGGPCPVQFYIGKPGESYSFSLQTIERIGPDSVTTIQASFREVDPEINNIYVKLDPYNVILEPDEKNNRAVIKQISTHLVIDNFEYNDSPLKHRWVKCAATGNFNTIFDNSLNSRVLQLSTGEPNNFALCFPDSNFLYTKKWIVSAKLKTDKLFTFSIEVQDSSGKRYKLQYIPEDAGTTLFADDILIPIGSSYRDGQWHTLRRNLDEDLFAKTGVHISYVLRFHLTGTCYLDDLVLEAQNQSVRKITDINETGWPDEFKVNQNNPDPLNGITTLYYQLPDSGKVHIGVFNSAGKKIKTLFNDFQDPGYYLAKWNGQDGDGNDVRGGLYFCKIEADDNVVVKKMLLVK